MKTKSSFQKIVFKIEEMKLEEEYNRLKMMENMMKISTGPFPS